MVIRSQVCFAIRDGQLPVVSTLYSPTLYPNTNLYSLRLRIASSLLNPTNISTLNNRHPKTIPTKSDVLGVVSFTMGSLVTGSSILGTILSLEKRIRFVIKKIISIIHGFLYRKTCPKLGNQLQSNPFLMISLLKHHDWLKQFWDVCFY